ncbi:RecX family transcriptional regulator [Leucobacter sp. gxy201]|uniref:regulatory protein RecX n=1 Tax=Leucobacter sp. gxy201 TaxID=2957200 RepID=UPI003D9FDA7F
MAVRFLPGPEERRAAHREDRTDLAEVIELRSRLPRPGWGDAPYRSGGVETAAADAPEPVAAVFGAPDAEETDGAPAPVVDAETVYADAVERCREDGVRMLARQARSSGELRDALLRVDHGRDVVEDVIDEFERSLYLDDTGLARAMTEKLREAKRASRGQIRTKLRERQIRDDVAEAVLGELDDDQEFEMLREAAADRARKLGGLERQTAERRLMGFLARRGWSGEPVSRAVREALDDAGISYGPGGSSGSGRGGPGRPRPGARARESGVRFQ